MPLSFFLSYWPILSCQSIDQANNRDIEIIPLKHSQATDLQQTLNSLIKTTATKGQPTTDSPTLIADERTNSLILNGDPTWRTSMRLLIAQLDTPIPNDDNTEVVYLKYAAAKELLEEQKNHPQIQSDTIRIKLIMKLC